MLNIYKKRIEIARFTMAIHAKGEFLSTLFMQTAF